MGPVTQSKSEAKSIRSPLPPGNNRIRLLRLMPNRIETADIKCELFHYSLEPDNSTHLYDALSYVWGDLNKTVPIFVNEHVLSVTENLHAALVHLRDRSFERIIWVDALCIDQDNEKEKIQQIRIMARIYAQANRVIAWLGNAGDDSDQALEAIRRATENESANESNSQQAIVALLQRPWFERIWVRDQKPDNISRGR